MSTYKVGNGNKQITLAADINTFGLAASRAIILDINTTDPEITVGNSVDATGDISRTDIGTCDTINGKRLSIMTKIDLIGDLEARKKNAESTGAKYFLDEGADGHKSFSDPLKEVSQDFTTVILFKTIDLIP
jgi:hypothetical protein